MEIEIVKKMGKKGQAFNQLTDKLLEVTIFALLGGALTPIVLNAFLNLSTSGIALSALFGTILGILFAVFIFKGITKTLK